MLNITLEKRPSDSKLMSYLSPLFAILLTLLSGGLLFTALGQDPFHALYTFFVLPLITVSPNTPA